MPQKGSWSMKEYQYARKLRHERTSFCKIAMILDRTESAVRAKLSNYHEFRTGRLHGKVRKTPMVVPLNTSEEWLLRGMLQPRDLTAAICGDPLPGYSALDRRSAA